MRISSSFPRSISKVADEVLTAAANLETTAHALTATAETTEQTCSHGGCDSEEAFGNVSPSIEENGATVCRYRDWHGKAPEALVSELRWDASGIPGNSLLSQGSSLFFCVGNFAKPTD
jgi:hypothetical protein